jgi:hypothetical protein
MPLVASLACLISARSRRLLHPESLHIHQVQANITALNNADPPSLATADAKPDIDIPTPIHL